MRIHTDRNGLAVNAISTLSDGTDVEGHVYQILAGARTLQLEFQRGPVPANGVNGATNEAMISILIHRLAILNGKFPSPFNEQALYHLGEALDSLEARTAERQARGVEGQLVA